MNKIKKEATNKKKDVKLLELKNKYWTLILFQLNIKV